MAAKRPNPKKGASSERALRAVEPVSRVTYEDWDWWPCDEDRRSAAKKEFDKLPQDVRSEFLDRIDRLLDGKSRFKEVKDVGQGILELRYRAHNNEYRILFFVYDGLCVAATCFYKNTKKLDKVDLDRAKERRKTYLATETKAKKGR